MEDVQSSHAEYQTHDHALRFRHLQTPDRWEWQETEQEIGSNVHPSRDVKVV